MDFTHLIAFNTAAKYQHISKAASELSITQPALSMTISKLEKELGTQLFDRVGQGVRLSQSGSVLYSYTQKILKEFESMSQKIFELQQGLRGSIHIGLVLPISSVDWLADLFEQYSEQYPAVEISVFSGPQSVLVELLGEHKLDYALITQPSPAGFQYQLLYQERLGVLAHRELGETTFTVASAAALPIFFSTSDRDMRWRFLSACKTADIQPDIRYDGVDLEYILQKVYEKQGITLMSSVQYHNLLQTGLCNTNLHFYPLMDSNFLRSIGIISQPDAIHDYAAEQFYQRASENTPTSVMM